MVRAALSLPLILLLSACGDDSAPHRPTTGDPEIARALDDPLMVDPDLSSRNEGAAAITVRTDGPLPVMTASPEEVARARAEAIAMAGNGGQLVPVPGVTGKIAPLASPHGPADHLAVLADKSACRAKLTDSAIWAARLPTALPVYPRGATLAATGGDGSGCRVAAVVFSTAVPLSDVLAFYWQRAKAARLAPIHRAAGDWTVLSGARTGMAFDLRAIQSGGVTTVELATVTG